MTFLRENKILTTFFVVSYLPDYKTRNRMAEANNQAQSNTALWGL